MCKEILEQYRNGEITYQTFVEKMELVLDIFLNEKELNEVTK